VGHCRQMAIHSIARGLGSPMRRPVNFQPHCLHASTAMMRHTASDAATRLEVTASRAVTCR
jgi:hypothetical protein